MSYSCVFKILRIKQVLSWWWCCACHLSPIADGSRSDAYKPNFSSFIKRCLTCSLFTNNSLSLTISLISSPPHLEGHGKIWRDGRCRRRPPPILVFRASCKQARSTTMMIVTADGEADYGMPNTAPVLRCHLRRRVLSLHCEEQHVIIWPTGSTVLVLLGVLHW